MSGVGTAPDYDQSILIYQPKYSSSTTQSVKLKLHAENMAGLISPSNQWIYGQKMFKGDVYFGDSFQYYIFPDNANNQRNARMDIPSDLSLKRSEASATGIAYIRNRAIKDFTTTSTSGLTYYHKQNGGATLLLGSTCIVDKTNTDGTISTLNSNYYSGFRYPSFNSTTHEYTGYDVNFYLPNVYTLDLTKDLTYYLLTTANWQITNSNRLIYTTSTNHGGTGATSSHYCNNTQLGVNTATVDNYNFVVAGKSKFSGEVYVDGNKVIISDTYYPAFELRAKTANSASTYSSVQFECNYTDNAGMWIWSDYTDSTKSRRGLILYGYKSGRDSNNCVALRQCDAEGTWLNDLYLLHSGNYSNYALPLTGGNVSGSINMGSFINFNNIEAGAQSAGLSWTGSTDYAQIFYYVPSSDEGHLVLDVGDDDNASIIFCRSGTATTEYAFGKNWFDVLTADTHLYKNLYVEQYIQSKKYFEAIEANQSWIAASHEGRFRVTGKPTAQSASGGLTIPSHNGSWGMATLYGTDNLYFVYGSDVNYSAGTNNTTNITFGSGGQVYGAVWNDYAEYRQASTKEPGRCVVEKGDDTLELSTARLLPGANIVSDTFGFAIGETKNCTTPIAVSGRVLAYPYEPRNQFKAGDAVCSGPNGTVSIMTREEIKEYPERIIGTVSSIPTYKKWGTGDVSVNGRVWIKV